ncbi:MAG: hypothetical protein RBT49_18675 [Bacteroidales bacterium]|jgi:hypothetical protein|nr:hypothetical protein [Bacteroidales bacterium]
MKKIILFSFCLFFLLNSYTQCEGTLIIKGIQKNNSFINISNDSISKLTYNILTNDHSVEYDSLIGSEIFIIINIDTIGYISSIDCFYNTSNSDLLFIKIKEIIKQLQPFNPFFGSNNKNIYGFAINFKFYKKKIEITY